MRETKEGLAVGVDGSDVKELTLKRYSNVDSVVVLSLRRMTYLGDDVELMLSAAAVVMSSEVTMGIFWMVPQTGESLRVIMTRVPGGKGSGTGSVRFFIRPHVRPPL